jgi:hypothetical protein
MAIGPNKVVTINFTLKDDKEILLNQQKIQNLSLLWK